MSSTEHREGGSDFTSLLPTLEGVVEALGDGRMPEDLAPLHEFLDNDLRPRLRRVRYRCRVLESTQERELMVALLARDVSDIEWYAGRIESTLLSLELRNGSSLSAHRSLATLFARLLSAVELAAAIEIEMDRRPNNCREFSSHSVTRRREEP
jgi:hypothetical protein